MDLTKTYPASVSTKIFGVVQLQRAIDKAKALAHGAIGEYNYKCPMDIVVFEFLGLDHEALLDAVRTAKTDKAIAAYVKPFVTAKSPQDIDDFNHKVLTSAEEPGSYPATLFLSLRDELCPERTDILTFPDLIDFDEDRLMPHGVLQPAAS